ncbi:hypothetical protein AAFF_G00069100 [Aldrovandia affinis]|uniref:Uncharacterized protein n=1 Tax=Aldrovandia affinis TaxID=143900 RepID=A0AAD7S1K5_9TELE|nr:hypothetical protein AAFF_G00069100 [Aldrovandia affinis]
MHTESAPHTSWILTVALHGNPHAFCACPSTRSASTCKPNTSSKRPKHAAFLRRAFTTNGTARSLRPPGGGITSAGHVRVRTRDFGAIFTSPPLAVGHVERRRLHNALKASLVNR